MKWIKYQIVQSTIGKEDILINKKVGYSNENLAIAEKEAYNGYEIIDDEQSFEKEPLAIEFGGTGAKTAEGARQRLGVAPAGYGLGSVNAKPITTVEQLDTTFETGWYNVTLSTDYLANNINARYCLLEVGSYDEWNQVQKLYPVDSTMEIIRYRRGTVLSPWECDTPHMFTDVEYRTTERIDSKAVYKKKDSSGQILYRLDGETEWKTQYGLMGAAPADYGLGEELRINTISADDLEGTGFYYCGLGVPNDWGNSYIIHLNNGGYKKQIALTLAATTGYQNLIAIREQYSYVWGEWEYVNPPMLFGVEYRTTERLHGKPVYVRAFDLGYGCSANSVKDVEHGISNYQYFISCQGFTSWPTASPTAGYIPTDMTIVSVVDNYLRISSTVDAAGTHFYAILKYTKTTD